MAELELLHSKSDVFYDQYERKAELQNQTHYCPGCGHGVAHKLIAEAIADLGIQNETIFVSPVGCSVFGYYYFDVGNVQAAHGRAPAVATALKRSCPGKIVVSYQGDGDLAAIGTAEIVHAANRGENITVFFVNNAIYGMTGGQLAPTTLVGQTSTTTPWGRRSNNEGYPLHISELLATLKAPVYIERVALNDNKNVMRALKAIRKALDLQKRGAGFTLVEILSPCPTIWKKDPIEARRWISEQMVPVFPVGVFRDRVSSETSALTVPQRPVLEVLELLNEIQPNARKLRNTSDLSINIAGFGGQGVLLAGVLLTESGMREGLQVSWLPSYGPEMRSGSAHCYVCLSHEPIGSPLVPQADVLVAMNEISLRKFATQVKAGGTILFNQSKLPDGFCARHANVICIPASQMADKIGSAKVANMVMIGALLERTGCLPPEVILEVVKSSVKNTKLLEANRLAIQAGRDFIDKQVLTEAISQWDGFAG